MWPTSLRLGLDVLDNRLERDGPNFPNTPWKETHLDIFKRRTLEPDNITTIRIFGLPRIPRPLRLARRRRSLSAQ